MKTKLPKKSQTHQKTIDEITQIIKKVCKKKISHIVLFGSFARGNWVDDCRQESDGRRTTYNSDYDILIITKRPEMALGMAEINLRNKIKKTIDENVVIDEKRPVAIIIESLKFVNKELRKGQFFFSDIKKEGILLYQEKGIELAQAEELSNQERKKISEEYFENWFESAEVFLENFNINLAKSSKSHKYLNIAAFNLHQTVENLYYCTHLVFTNYCPKIHNLTELKEKITPYCEELANTLLQNTEEEKKHFNLLNRAYVEARYNKNYKITKEELGYLVIRVEELKEIVKRVCEEKINSFVE